MTSSIYHKTPKGRAEAAEQTRGLTEHQRTLLLLVNGRRNKEELIAKATSLGLKEKALNDLLDAGLIQIGRSQKAAVKEPVPTSSPAPSAPSASAKSRRFTKKVTSEIKPVSKGVLRNGENQYQALHGFFTETIRNAIGLRGYGMQLRVERAAKIADFRELRSVYLELVRLIKGPELERRLGSRLDQLLSLGD